MSNTIDVLVSRLRQKLGTPSRIADDSRRGIQAPMRLSRPRKAQTRLALVGALLSVLFLGLLALGTRSLLRRRSFEAIDEELRTRGRRRLGFRARRTRREAPRSSSRRPRGQYLRVPSREPLGDPLPGRRPFRALRRISCAPRAVSLAPYARRSEAPYTAVEPYSGQRRVPLPGPAPARQGGRVDTVVFRSIEPALAGLARLDRALLGVLPARVSRDRRDPGLRGAPGAPPGRGGDPARGKRGGLGPLRQGPHPLGRGGAAAALRRDHLAPRRAGARLPRAAAASGRRGPRAENAISIIAGEAQDAAASDVAADSAFAPRDDRAHRARPRARNRRHSSGWRGGRGSGARAGPSIWPSRPRARGGAAACRTARSAVAGIRGRRGAGARGARRRSASRRQSAANAVLYTAPARKSRSTSPSRAARIVLEVRDRGRAFPQRRSASSSDSSVSTRPATRSGRLGLGLAIVDRSPACTAGVEVEDRAGGIDLPRRFPRPALIPKKTPEPVEAPAVRRKTRPPVGGLRRF